jgi:transcriptional regulator with XRE-family HTH domain
MTPRDRKETVLYTRFQARLKQLLEREEMSQDELMAALNWGGDSSYLSQIKGGHRGISIERVEELAAFFKVDPGIFFIEIDTSEGQVKTDVAS